MKYLSNYIEDAQSAAFEKNGAFFAFSDKQLSEKKVEGVKYVSLGSGLICPKENADKLHSELTQIVKDGVKQDVEENGIEKIIERELANHEAYYTGDLDDTLEALSCYDELVTEEIVAEIYRKNLKNHLND